MVLKVNRYNSAISIHKVLSMLTLYNSLTKTKETFTPMEEGKISLYVCGMTVYDYCHLGHARVMVAFDVISRYLRSLGYRVNYVRNITDVDDKIIARANERGESIAELTDYFIKAMDEDAKALGVIPPDREPRATQHIGDMLAIIETLIEKEFAYPAENGDVYYHVSAFKDYGKLSHRLLEDMRAGARVEVNKSKRDPLDFVLWKAAKEGEPGWDSPWGYGRPGWHIECSAMSTQCLGKHIDIHGGGPDLMFPHHENEIAQSEAANEEKLANYWIHVGSLQMNNEKMSKSIGNFMTIRDTLKLYPAEVIRYFFLSGHYRSPLNYADDALSNAQAGLERFYQGLRDLPSADEAEFGDYKERFCQAMLDDFNTPLALSVLFDMVKEMNKTREEDSKKAARLGLGLVRLAKHLGILQQDPTAFLQGDQRDAAAIKALIEKREQARADKDWQASDDIRDELAAMGVELQDNDGGTTWTRR